MSIVNGGLTISWYPMPQKTAGKRRRIPHSFGVSKYKDQRRQQIEEERQRQSKRRRWLAVGGTVLVLASGAAVWYRGPNTSKVNATPALKSADEKSTLAALLALKPHQLEGLDIGLVNLLCAEGLPGAENLDVDESLDCLDQMANRVRSETARNMHQFFSKPDQFQNSEANFRMGMLVTVLQQDFRIRYNPDLALPAAQQETDVKFFANSHDLFLHGLTGEMRTGTCSSLPVLYVAIGRRLNYPLSLVAAKAHYFVRWEDQSTRFNIEATNVGVGFYDDDHYRKWPYPMTAGEEKDMGYLKNLTPAQEFAGFLSIRGFCLLAAGRFDESMATFEQAKRTGSDSPYYYAAQLRAIKREEATRTGEYTPGIGMPPDPTLMSDPPEAAWAQWHVEEDLRRRGLAPTPPYLKPRGPGRWTVTEISTLPQSPPER